jgi:predicted nuclease of predicted toxin-antitoxin system
VSLRLFIDQCVPRSVSESIRDAGHTVELLRSHLPINAKDPDVIDCAQSLDAVLVTLNGDFADSLTTLRYNTAALSHCKSGIIRNRDALAYISPRTP